LSIERSLIAPKAQGQQSSKEKLTHKHFSYRFRIKQKIKDLTEPNIGRRPHIGESRAVELAILVSESRPILD
jgi:hypothetical protein